MPWQAYEKAAERGPAAILWKVGFLFLGIVIVVGLVGFVLNPFRQAGRIVNQTIDADNVLYNYEWFKQRHEGINAIDRKIEESKFAITSFDEAAGDRADWHREDREEHARLSAVLLGLKQQRADLAAEYNARSRMVNRSIFKAGDVELPERIPE